MDIFPIKAFKDNYIWCGIDSGSKAWVVDPGDAMPVIEFLRHHNAILQGILVTHHHFDHTGGIPDLLDCWPEAMVVASSKSQNEYVTQRLSEGERITTGSLELLGLEIPGHTLDHLAFYGNGCVFCGDTLFSAGCGRVFEGTLDQMYHTLLRLKALPDDTKVFCGHEYTEANLRFALAVEPENSRIFDRLREVEGLRSQGKPTLPAHLGAEKGYNPFLRCDVPAVMAAAEGYAKRPLRGAQEVFAVLREWKNGF